MGQKIYGFGHVKVLTEAPVAAQVRGMTVHLQFADGRYTGESLRRPQDPDDLAALYTAIGAQDTEPTWSGTGRAYYKLTVGKPVKIKYPGMGDLAMVPITAGPGGPVATFVLVDPAAGKPKALAPVPNAQDSYIPAPEPQGKDVAPTFGPDSTDETETEDETEGEDE